MTSTNVEPKLDTPEHCDYAKGNPATVIKTMQAGHWQKDKTYELYRK
jgi:hypothetical protein